MPPEIKEWLGLIIQLTTLGGVFYVWLTSGAKKAAADLQSHKDADADKKQSLDRDIGAIDRRVQAIETEMKHLPSKESISDLKLTIAELKGTVGSLTAEVNGMTRTVHLIDDYLRNEKK